MSKLSTNQERRELLSKATLAIAEHSIALHEAQEGTENIKEELELERKDTDKLRLKLTEARTFDLCLKGGVVNYPRLREVGYRLRLNDFQRNNEQATK